MCHHCDSFTLTGGAMMFVQFNPGKWKSPLKSLTLRGLNMRWTNPQRVFYGLGTLSTGCGAQVSSNNGLPMIQKLLSIETKSFGNIVLIWNFTKSWGCQIHNIVPRCLSMFMLMG